MENVLLLIKTSKLEMRQNMLPFCPARCLSSLFVFLCDVLIFSGQTVCNCHWHQRRGAMAGRGGRVPITKKRNKASLLLFCVVHLMIFDRKMIKFSAHRVCIQIQSLQPQLGVSSGGKIQGITSPGQLWLI